VWTSEGHIDAETLAGHNVTRYPLVRLASNLTVAGYLYELGVTDVDLEVNRTLTDILLRAAQADLNAGMRTPLGYLHIEPAHRY